MDQSTRKLMTIYEALHRWVDIHRLSVSRKGRRRKLASIEVDASSIRGLEDKIKKCKERLIKAASYSTDNRTIFKKWDTEMGSKTTVWLFQATNRLNLTRKKTETATNRKQKQHKTTP